MPVSERQFEGLAFWRKLAEENPRMTKHILGADWKPPLRETQARILSREVGSRDLARLLDQL